MKGPEPIPTAKPRPAAFAATIVTLLALAPPDAFAKKDEPPPVSICHAVAVRDATLYAGHSGMLLARDITDPANPKLVGNTSVPGEALGVELVGERAYVASGMHGVSVVGLVDPWVPVYLGRYNTQGSVRSLAVRGTIVAIADDIRGLEIADLADLEKPASLASFPTRDRLNVVVWPEAFLATAEGEGGIRLIDMKEPKSPKVLATLDAVRPVSDVAVCDGNLVVAAAGAKGIAIYDAADPKRPTQVGKITTNGRALFVHCTGRTLLVSESSAQLQLFDLTAPTRPQPLETIALPRGTSAGKATLSNDLIFIALGPNGLGVVRRIPGEKSEILLPRPRKMTISFP